MRKWTYLRATSDSCDDQEAVTVARSRKERAETLFVDLFTRDSFLDFLHLFENERVVH